MSARTRAKISKDVSDAFAAADEKVPKLDLGATPNAEVDDDVSKEFFKAGEKIDKEHTKAAAAGETEKTEKKERTLYSRVRDIFFRRQEAVDNFKKEVEAIKKGNVGAESGLAIAAAETKNADNLIASAEKVNRSKFKVKLSGDYEDHLDTIDGMYDALVKECQSNFNASDAVIFQNLLEKGSTQDPVTGKYTNATEGENARLAALSGPVVTRDVLAKMCAGEIPWTANGAFLAGQDLRRGRWPTTGKRIKAREINSGLGPNGESANAKVLKFPTGEVLVGAAAAAAAVAAAAESFKGIPGKFGDTFFAAKKNVAAETKAKLDTREEAGTAQEILATEYKERYQAALEERRRLREELIDTNRDFTFFSAIEKAATPAERSKLLRRDLKLVTRYHRQYAAIHEEDERVRAQVEKMTNGTYHRLIKKNLETKPSADQEQMLEDIFLHANLEIKTAKERAQQKLAGNGAELAEILDKLIFYSPSASIPQIEFVLHGVERQIKTLDTALQNELDKNGGIAREWQNQRAAAWAEKIDLEQRLANLKKRIDKNPNPNDGETVAMENAECESRLKKTTERLTAARQELEVLYKKTNPTEDESKRYIALKWELIDLEEKIEIEKHLLNKLAGNGDLPDKETTETGSAKTDRQAADAAGTLKASGTGTDEADINKRDRLAATGDDDALDEQIRYPDWETGGGTAIDDSETGIERTPEEIIRLATARLFLCQDRLAGLTPDTLQAEADALKGASGAEAITKLLANGILTIGESKKLSDKEIISLTAELASVFRLVIDKITHRPPDAATIAPDSGTTDAETKTKELHARAEAILNDLKTAVLENLAKDDAVNAGEKLRIAEERLELIKTDAVDRKGKIRILSRIKILNRGEYDQLTDDQLAALITLRKNHLEEVKAKAEVRLAELPTVAVTPTLDTAPDAKAEIAIIFERTGKIINQFKNKDLAQIEAINDEEKLNKAIEQINDELERINALIRKNNIDNMKRLLTARNVIESAALDTLNNDDIIKILYSLKAELKEVKAAAVTRQTKIGNKAAPGTASDPDTTNSAPDVAPAVGTIDIMANVEKTKLDKERGNLNRRIGNFIKTKPPLVLREDLTRDELAAFKARAEKFLKAPASGGEIPTPDEIEALRHDFGKN